MRGSALDSYWLQQLPAPRISDLIGRRFMWAGPQEEQEQEGVSLCDCLSFRII